MGLVKKILIGVAVLFAGILVLGAILPSETKEQPTIPSAEQALPSYEVASRDESPLGNAQRFEIRAVTDFPVSEDQIKEITERIIEEQKGIENFNAMVIFFYDRKELTYGAYSLAKATYAPDGDWSKAREVETGDYSRHQTVYEFEDKVKDPEKYADKRPTEEEAKLCKAFDEMGVALTDPASSEVLEDEEIASKVSEQTGASVEEILDAASKCAWWTSAM